MLTGRGQVDGNDTPPAVLIEKRVGFDHLQCRLGSHERVELLLQFRRLATKALQLPQRCRQVAEEAGQLSLLEPEVRLDLEHLSTLRLPLS